MIRILLDLDGVLADWVGGVARLWGLTKDELLVAWEPGVWEAEKPLSRAVAEKRRHWRSDLGHGDDGPLPKTPAPVLSGGVMTTEQFWRPINDTPGFWLGLDPLPWCKPLFDLCLRATGGGYAETDEGDVVALDPGDLWVVTAPSRCPGCVREKEGWVLHHLGLPHDRMVPTRHKYLLAKPGVLLVDDNETNVREFRREGGLAVLFPAVHNRHWDEAADPLSTVTAYLGSPTGQGPTVATR